MEEDNSQLRYIRDAIFDSVM